jgi:hypothetical protein
MNWRLRPADDAQGPSRPLAARATGSQPGWPTCAVCRRPVERVETARNVLDGTVQFTARCHGDVETATVTESDLTRANGLCFGVAFERELGRRAR